MIHDLPPLRAPLVGVLADMAGSPLAFHLTGSRFHGIERPDSDWDFFIEQAPGVADALRALGFTSLGPDSEYEAVQDDASDTVDVLAVVDNLPGIMVQVQLVTNVARAQRVRDVIRAHFHARDEQLRGQGDKSERRALWRACAAFVRVAMPDEAPPAAAPALVPANGAADDDDSLPF